MHVKIESIGGFAGREVVVAEYDTDDLPPGEAAQTHAALAELAAHGVDGEIGADLPAYRVTADHKVYELTGDPPPRLATPLNTLLRSDGG